MPEETVKTTRRWVKVLLAVSLALNFLVLGAIGAAVFSNKFGKGPFAMHKSSFGAFTRALSWQDRKAIGKGIRKEMQDLPKSRKSYQALRSALLADVYDKDAVHKLVAEHQKAGLIRQEISQRLFLERLDNMSPQQRRKFAKRLGRPWKHRK